jgi:predicted MFS family arabinose efflux permease
MGASEWRMLTPLVLATMASQAMIVVLSPTIVTTAADLGTSVPAIGQARSITATVSVVASVVVGVWATRLSIRRALAAGAGLAIVAGALVATAGTVPLFLASHVVVGVAQALLLSSAFAGVAAFGGRRRGWATGYVAGAQALAWVVVNPGAAALAEHVTWRVAYLIPASIALGALTTVHLAHPLPSSQSADHWAPVRVRPARRWIGAEATGFAAWTALLTFSGAFFIEHTGAQVGVTGWILAAGAFAYFLAATQSGRLGSLLPRRVLVAGAALLMAAFFPVMLTAGLPTAGAAVVFAVLGLLAGVRTPASAGLGLETLPGQPAAIMAARTAATQVGYLIGAVVGGTVIASWGYAPLGPVLAGVMVLSAILVLRIGTKADSGHST